MKSRLLMRAGATVRFCDPASSIGGIPIVLAAGVSVRRPDDESRAIIGGGGWSVPVMWGALEWHCVLVRSCWSHCPNRVSLLPWTVLDGKGSTAKASNASRTREGSPACGRFVDHSRSDGREPRRISGE